MVLLTPRYSDWLSHPRTQSNPKGKTLKSHTSNVRDGAIIRHDCKIVRYGSVFHDVGKLNLNFGDHIRGLLVTGYKNHSYLSMLAFFNWYHMHRQHLTSMEAMATAMCILKHHGSLGNIDSAISTESEEWQNMVAFLRTNPDMPVDQMLFDFGLITDPGQFLSIPEPRLIPFSRRLELGSPLDFYFETRMSFSALVSADKQDAGNYAKENKEIKKDRKFFKDYQSKLTKHLTSCQKIASPINAVRDEIREYARATLQRNLVFGHRVFSLTSPTGSGKTLMLLYLAMDIIRHVGKSMSTIYAVPFLAITEQVFDVFKSIYDPKASESDYSPLKRIDCKSAIEERDEARALGRIKQLLKRLMRRVVPENQDKVSQGLLNGEFMEATFDYPLITTTFVQLFEAFTTRSNKGLMKYSNMKNCIFLVDELQALPPRLYTFFTAMLDEHCRRYNCYAILSTATMPCFDIGNQSYAKDMFTRYTCPVELSDLAFYERDVFNRYRIQVLQQSMFVPDLVEHIMGQTLSCLVILNTIRDSEETYRALRSLGNTCKIILLNSNFYSDARSVKLKGATKCLDNGEKVILVTTQLIEAGVDIDFPVVYRDIAPLPSIIQAAGRCNRNGHRSEGLFFLFRLYDINHPDKLRASYIYNGMDQLFLEHSIQQFFGDRSTFMERDLMPLQRDYFQDIIADRTRFGFWMDGRREKNFVALIRFGKFHDIGDFKVIPPEHYGHQIRFYVPVDENDRSFDDLLQYGADILVLEETAGRDLKEILALKRRQRLHLKKMYLRMVQALLSDDDLANLGRYVVHEEAYLDMHELRPGLYDEELGLRL